MTCNFSYDALASFSPVSKPYLDSWIESFEVINDRELVIRHRDVFTHSNLLAMTTFPVKPAHYYADRDDPYEITLEVPLGNGPYRITDYMIETMFSTSASRTTGPVIFR